MYDYATIQLNKIEGGKDILLFLSDVASPPEAVGTGGTLIPLRNGANLHVSESLTAVQTAINALRTDYLAAIRGTSPFSWGSPVSVTIASGVLTISSGGNFKVDTEAAGASDDLDTINGGSDGQLIILRAANSARTVVVKDGAGNIKSEGDMSLDNAEDTITLLYDSALAYWVEQARANNGA